MIIPYNLKKVRDIKLTETDLIDFETEVKERYESGEITAPVHLTKSNEKELMEIFQYIHPEDWVFCGHRNHYHALLHGVEPSVLKQKILLIPIIIFYN